MPERVQDDRTEGGPPAERPRRGLERLLLGKQLAVRDPLALSRA